jgi:glycerol uptake facilitator-like aquaporin
VPILEVSSKLRDGPSQWFSEFVATFGLVMTVVGGGRPALIGLYIIAAYWFTASTSFANPAVTVARMLTESFSGIAPISAPAFLVAQLAGALSAGMLARWLFGLREHSRTTSRKRVINLS